MPVLDSSNLRQSQIEAIKGLEDSFSKNRMRSLVHMSTGAGKTFAAVSSVYRLLKFAKAKRVLFLVDRNNLGAQALKAFQSYTTPDTGEKFKELYEIQYLQSNTIEDVDVVITTIQRMYSILKGEKEFDHTSGQKQTVVTMTSRQKSKNEYAILNNISRRCERRHIIFARPRLENRCSHPKRLGLKTTRSHR